MAAAVVKGGDMAGVFGKEDTDSIVTAIMHLTGGEKRSARVLAEMCKFRPLVFRGKSAEEDETIFRTVVERVTRRQLPAELGRDYWISDDEGLKTVEVLERQVADLPKMRIRARVR